MKDNLFIYVLGLALISIVFLSRGKVYSQDDLCFLIEDPMEELEWLNDIVERHNSMDVDRKADIYEYTYKDEKLYLADMCVGCPDFITVVFNCRGIIVCEFGGITGKNTCPDIEEESISKRLIWSTWQDVRGN